MPVAADPFVSDERSPAHLADPTDDATVFTGGGFHVPSRIEGAVSSGQYMRSMRMNLPSGAGSQFDSLSAPGESFWTRRSTEPSGLDLRFCRGLMEQRLIGLATKKYSALYIVSDQKPSIGGNSPLAKCMTYLLAPS